MGEFLVFLDKVAADSSVVDFSEGFSNATVHIHNAGTKCMLIYWEKNFNVIFHFRLCVSICEHIICTVGGFSCCHLFTNH